MAGGNCSAVRAPTKTTVSVSKPATHLALILCTDVAELHKLRGDDVGFGDEVEDVSVDAAHASKVAEHCVLRKSVKWN